MKDKRSKSSHMSVMPTNSSPKIPRQKLPLFIGIISAALGSLVLFEAITYLFAIVSVQDEIVQKYMDNHCHPPVTITSYERRLCTNWRLEYASGVLSMMFGLAQAASSIAIILLAQRLKKYWWLSSVIHAVLAVLMIIPSVCIIDVYKDRKEYCNRLVQEVENRVCSGCGPAIGGSALLRKNSDLTANASLDQLAACTFRHHGNPSDLQLADAFVVFFFLCLIMDVFFCFGAGGFLLFFHKELRSKGQGVSETVFSRSSQASAFGDGADSAARKSSMIQMQAGQDGPPPDTAT